MDLKNKNVLIIGMARSGISVAKLCSKLKANVTIQDKKNKHELKDIVRELEKLNVNCIFEKDPDDIINNQDLIVLSPGVPTDLLFLQKARLLDIPIVSEVELAYMYCSSPIIGITGTNGKTTTTSLVGQIVKKYLPNSKVVGNIGNPFSEYVLQMQEKDYVVAELSSFQLELIHRFTTKVCAVLNITPDHLNRHKTFENYVKAKENIFKNQKEEDYCILNYDDDICRNLASKINSKVIYFSRQYKLEKGVYLEDEHIVLNVDNNRIDICNIHDLKILGNHNIENAMATVAICYCAKIPLEIIKEQIKVFEGVEHRIEYVDTINGVKYYNDSKATNPEAAIKGLEAMKWSTVLIGGGMDKGSDFKQWINCFNDKVKKLIVFGETADKIIKTAYDLKFEKVEKVENLQEAVQVAYKTVQTGECVLLSPACASWDMFKSYEERGELFKDLVMQLKG